ncbi:hypothetical protein [Rugosimonospora acidiphila]
MAAFSSNEEDRGQWDYELLHDGAVSGFRDEEHLSLVVSHLRDLGYGIAETRGCHHTELLQHLLSQVSMHYCGWSVKNLDALRYIDFSAVTGWALVIRDFDLTYHADQHWAREVADIVAEVSYEHLLRGNRLLALLHCEGHELKLGRLGGHEPWWRGTHRRAASVGP